MTNPGHLLAGIGIALVAVGLVGALVTLVVDVRGARLDFGPARLGLGAAVAVLALVAGVTGAWAAGAGGHDGHDPATAAAGGQDPAAAENLWKASMANAERWRDPEAAAAAGFRFKDDGRAGPGGKVRFLHMPNPAWRADGRVLDPAHPETLVYWNGPGGRLTLVGVMYTAARGSPGPTVGGPITRWHDHETCRDPATGAKLGRPVDGTCPDGQVYRRSGEMLHVWFSDDLGAAFARRASLAGLRSSNAWTGPFRA